SGTPARWDTTVRATHTARPQGSSLRSGLSCPGPSTLNRPHPPHSQAHPDFAARRLIRGAFAVRERLGDPRVVPCFRCALCLGMSSSTTPESPSAVRHPDSPPKTLAFALLSRARHSQWSPKSASRGVRVSGLTVRTCYDL